VPEAAELGGARLCLVGDTRCGWLLQRSCSGDLAGPGHPAIVGGGEGLDGKQAGDIKGRSWPPWRRACLDPDLGPYGIYLGWRAVLPGAHPLTMEWLGCRI
jgi:hypothetical protein